MIQTQFNNVYKETIELIINDTLEKLIESKKINEVSEETRNELNSNAIKFFEDRTGIEKGCQKQ